MSLKTTIAIINVRTYTSYTFGSCGINSPCIRFLCPVLTNRRSANILKYQHIILHLIYYKTRHQQHTRNQMICFKMHQNNFKL